MATETQVRESLEKVMVPGVMRSLNGLNLVRQLAISDKAVKITLSSTALNDETREWLTTKTKEVVGKLSGVKKVEIEFSEAKPAELNQIGNIIAVMSGKGGVGKSLVAGLAAIALKRQGYEVGILDADLTGPSIPKMFGITGRPSGSESGILPVLSRSGIEVMSINLLLPQEDDAVIWRGPLISNTIKQFWQDVLWGKLDYLLIDLPPGTADAPLTVMQSFPISGVLIVFTPQDLTAMIVRKAVNMAQKMDKAILGVVENMSYLYIPEMDKRIEIFGPSRGEEMAQASKAPLLGQLPLDPELARLCDQGEIEKYDSEIMNAFGQSLRQALAQKKTTP
ncbi:MAG: ATP-binding protein [Chloroflexi bacterium RBG_13_56_8b]|nr:MAG: ATP-binding protein [Chloroflexi bacterium RBG_13_56_8b]